MELCTLTGVVGGLRMKHILIIDDERLVTKSLAKLLKSKGYDAVVSACAEEALQKVKDSDFNLIVCDIRMPDTNGVETVSAIRGYLKKEGKAPIPEILITGYADEETYKEAVQLKVAGYINKPFDTNEFLDIVKRNIT